MLFTCPSRYSSTIGHTGVFSLGGWSPQLRARFLVPGATQEFRYDLILCSATGLSPSLALRSRRVHLTCQAASAAPTTPIPQGDRFGLDPFRSPLLRTSRLISLPPGTEMFQFPGFASALRRMTSVSTGRVSPFGHHWITDCVRLPSASRSLPRPSSPLCAQASPTRLRSLDHKFMEKQLYHTRDLTLKRVIRFLALLPSPPGRPGADRSRSKLKSR